MTESEIIELALRRVSQSETTISTIRHCLTMIADEIARINYDHAKEKREHE